MKVRSWERGSTAFSLIELLVVIAIIAVLIGLLLSAIQRVRESANRIKCTNQVKQLCLAVHSYETVYRMIPGIETDILQPPHGSFFYSLLPYIDQQNLYQLPYVQQQALYNQGLAASAFPNTSWNAVYNVPMPLYQCPNDYTMVNGLCDYGNALYAGTSYAANANLTASFNVPSLSQWIITPGTLIPSYRVETIPDGASNTILFAERYASNPWANYQWALWPSWEWGSYVWSSPAPWYSISTWPAFGYAFDPDTYLTPPCAGKPSRGGAYTCGSVQPNSMHIGTMVTGLADGSVRLVGIDISASTWKYAVLPADGQVLGADWEN
jgi:prepilin-type N-terminal cleavage/methylation domain-containing protein